MNLGFVRKETEIQNGAVVETTHTIPFPPAIGVNRRHHFFLQLQFFDPPGQGTGSILDGGSVRGTNATLIP